MVNEKKLYEEPTVTKVEFDLNDRMASSSCSIKNYDDDAPAYMCHRL